MVAPTDSNGVRLCGSSGTSTPTGEIGKIATPVCALVRNDNVGRCLWGQGLDGEKFALTVGDTLW